MASEQAVAASVVRSVWLEQPKFEAAERHYYEVQADRHSGLKIEVGSVWLAGSKSFAGFVLLQGKAVTVTARPSSITDFIGETRDMIEQTLMETSVSTSQTRGGVLGIYTRFVDSRFVDSFGRLINYS